MRFRKILNNYQQVLDELSTGRLRYHKYYEFIRTFRCSYYAKNCLDPSFETVLDELTDSTIYMAV